MSKKGFVGLVAGFVALYSTALPGQFAAAQDEATPEAAQRQDDEVVMIGPVERFDATMLVLSGGLELPIEDAEVLGDVSEEARVRLVLEKLETGVWAVTEVEVVTDETNSDDDDDDGDESMEAIGNTDDDIELSGMVEAVGDGYMIVGGLRINIATAELVAQPLAGNHVTVEFLPVGGQMVASKVELTDIEGDDDSRILTTLPTTCDGSIPEGWVVYNLAVGDTLTSVAERAGSTVEELVTANCIIEPGLIAVGAPIAVPRMPDPNPEATESRSGN